MNKIILCGNICKDIEIKYYNDKKNIKNTIAVRRDFKNKEGNYDSDFFNFTIWGVQAEFLNNYAKKGDKILISGKILNNNYEKDGQMIYSNDIQVETVEILSSKNQNGDVGVDTAKEIFGENTVEFANDKNLLD
jgi:single-strand DNA-binding protein